MVPAMVKLPSAQSVIIDRRKITNYLLCETHEEGGPKARFFISFGWSSDQPEALISALRQHATDHEVDRSYPDLFGQKFEIIPAALDLDSYTFKFT